MAKYVDSLITFIDRQRTLYGLKKEEEPVGPTPIITIDGVDYFNKCEFDLTTLSGASGPQGALYDILSGSRIMVPPSISDISEAAIMAKTFPVEQGNGKVCSIVYGPGDGAESEYGSILDIVIASDVPGQFPVNYQSKAFTCVDTWAEADATSKIFLPTCSAFYGMLSEDGKTFTAYFNLKEEQEQEPQSGGISL